MIVTFLGTGTSQGVPVIACDCKVCKSLDYRDKRLRTSIHIQTANNSIVVDTGPDFRQQLLRERITDVDAVLFTHEHKDHIAGLDDIRPINFIHHKDMPIYGAKRVMERLQIEFAYAFGRDKYPGTPDIEIHEIKNAPFELNRDLITPVQVYHGQMPVFGYRINDFTYITDIKYIDDAELEKIKGSRVIVFSGLQKEPHRTHFTFYDAVDLLKELKPEAGYLTHISHRLGLYKEVAKELPDWINLAYDGLQLEI